MAASMNGAHDTGPRHPFPSDTMALAAAVWVCSLPLVAIVLIPIAGLKAAGAAALGLLIIALGACWGICGRKAWSDPPGDEDPASGPDRAPVDRRLPTRSYSSRGNTGGALP